MPDQPPHAASAPAEGPWPALPPPGVFMPPGACAAGTIHHPDTWLTCTAQHLHAGAWPAAEQALAQAIILADQYHPLIHFQGSALHTDRARLRYNAGDMHGALADASHALFLDHRNATAAAMLAAGTDPAGWDAAPPYPEGAWTEAAYHGTVRLHAPPPMGTLAGMPPPYPSTGQEYPPEHYPGHHPGHHPNWAPAYDAIIHAWQQGTTTAPEAAGRLDAMLAAPPTDAPGLHRAWHRRALLHAAVGEPSAALAALDRAVEGDTAGHAAYHTAAAGLHLLRAWLFRQMDEPLLADAATRKARDLDRSHPLLHA